MITPLFRPEPFGQRVEHRTVKIHTLRHRHMVDLERDRDEAGAGEDVDHRAGTSTGKIEIVRLDQDKRALGPRCNRQRQGVALARGEPLQVRNDIRAGLRGREHALAQHRGKRARSVDRTNGRGQLGRRILPAKNKQGSPARRLVNQTGPDDFQSAGARHRTRQNPTQPSAPQRFGRDQ